MVKALLISWIILLAGLGWPGRAAAQPAQPDPGLAASLSASASALAPGEAARLTLFLVPPAAQTVEIVSLRPAGGQAWEVAQTPPLPLTLQSPAAVEITLIPQITGRLRPVVVVGYRLDGQPGQLLVEGDWLEVAPPPRPGAAIPWSSLLSFLTGAATAIAANLVIEWRKTLRQEALNRERAISLLKMVVLQARSAVEHGEALDLSPLQTIYQAEGLYKALHQANLDEPARRLWSCAAMHNRFTGRRQGWQPEAELAAAAGALEQTLAALAALKRQGLLARIKARLRRRPV